jgi:dsDNA-specific endonuclease/ATPase MutS2
MAISGLPIPAREATIPFYKSVLADIGDHQSLSANLSTFSSHISNIAGMMENCRSPSLVLLDEVGYFLNVKIDCLEYLCHSSCSVGWLLTGLN